MKVFKIYFLTGNICFIEGKNPLEALKRNFIKNEGVVKFETFNNWDEAFK